MATMTPSEVRNGNVSFGDMKGKIVDFAIGTYATSGLAVDPKSFGMSGLLGVQIVGGNAASGKYQYAYDTANKKLLVYQTATVTPTGTVAAPTFTGSALAAHSHVLYVGTGATDATGARVNAATNVLEMNNAGASIAGIAAASGNGGIVNNGAGTPAGTNSAPAFTGAATTAAALSEVSNGADLSLITVRLLGMGF